MKLNLLAAGTLMIAALPLAACQTTASTPQADAAPGLCRPDAAQALVGKNRIGDAEAKRMTGASLVRQIRPGDAVTMDFRQERVTIETSRKTGRIVRASCG